MSKHQVNVLFGDEAVSRWNDGQRSREELTEIGSIETVTFDTQAEVNAFRMGLSMMDGWAGYQVLEDEEVEEIVD